MAWLCSPGSDPHNRSLCEPSLTSRQLAPEEVGSQRLGVQAALRHGADGRRGAQEAPQPLLPVPDRAAGASQGPAHLRAADLPPVHRQTRGGPETQRAAAGDPADGQVSLGPGADTRPGLLSGLQGLWV